MFRYIDRKRNLTTQPQTAQWVSHHLVGLGIYLGLENRLLPGCLRRGSAFLLAENCTAEERTARMGHDNRDNVYFAHYRNEDLTHDFQAIVHSVEAENLEIMGSIALNRKVDAPRYPSDAGVLAALRDPELVRLLEEKAPLYDEIVLKYGSISKAEAADPRLFKEYKAATKKATKYRSRLLANTFQQEYRAFFQQDVVVAAVPEDIPDCFPLDPALGA